MEILQLSDIHYGTDYKGKFNTKDQFNKVVEHANFVCEECPARDVYQIDYFTTCGKQFRKWATTEVSK